MLRPISEPLVQNRIAVACPRVWRPQRWTGASATRSGLAHNPIRLCPDDWRSGDNHWVLDIIAPDEAAATKVLANFGQLAKGGSLKLRPAVARRLSPEALERMGAVQATGEGETN